MSDEIRLTAKIEPFDSFWEAPSNIEKGYSTSFKFYKHNYLKYFPTNKESRILVISCGPGYFVNLLTQEGYSDVLGIDSFPEKVEQSSKRKLNCKVANAFSFLQDSENPYDVILAEQEINHLTKDEVLLFLKLCREKE